VVSVSKGKVFFINHLYPRNSEKFFKIEIKPNNGKRLIAKEDLVIVVNSLHPSGIGAKELKFVRFERKDISRENLSFAEPASHPKLRDTLKDSSEFLYFSFGGMENSLIYSDEILISGIESDSGWILQEEDITRFLPEKEILLSIFVEHTKKGTARIVREVDALEKLQDMKLPETKVIAIFKITYNAISKKVVEIINMSTRKKSQKIIVSSSYPQKYITLGARFPDNL